MKECMYLQQQKSPPTFSPAHAPTAVAAATAAGNMPCWYYDKKELRDTPSILDGITYDTERRYRKEGARFIMTCGTQMGLGHNTMATGVVYFHRFYMFHSFKSFPRYVTACCCLFLAGKVEETPKKCRDIIKTARALLSDNYFYSFGEDPKEEVMTLERILLQTIKFDLQVEHPYTFLLKYAKCFKGDQQKLQKMVQMAWNFVNDSLSTVVCLQWEPEIIAVALIHLASKLSKFTVLDWVGRLPQHMRWWDMFVSDVTMEILEDICHQVLDLYQNQKEPAAEAQSPPQKPPSRADSPTPLKLITTTTTTPGSVSPSSASKTKAASVSVGAAIPLIGGAVIDASAALGLNNIQAIKSLANSAPSIAPPAGDHMSAAAIASVYQMYASAPPPPAHAMHTLYGTSAPAPPPPPPHGYGAGPLSLASSSSSSGNNVGNVVPPLPPPPQMPAYGAASNAWQPMGGGGGGGNSHYAHVPSLMSGNAGAGGPPPHGNGGGRGGGGPPLPPQGTGGGYYQAPPYGRQQRY